MAYLNLISNHNGKRYEINIQALASFVAKLEYANQNPDALKQFSESALDCAKDILHEIIQDPEFWETGGWTNERHDSVNFDDFFYDDDHGE